MPFTMQRPEPVVKEELEYRTDTRTSDRHADGEDMPGKSLQAV